MYSWEKVTLYQFQQIKKTLEDNNLSDMDKVLFNTCTLHNLTPFELDSTPPKKAMKLVNDFTNTFQQPTEFKPLDKIGKYFVDYDPTKMNLGQYISLSFYLSRGQIDFAHNIMATITHEKKKKYDVDKQEERFTYFLTVSVTKILGTVKRFAEYYLSFNKKYKNLFGLEGDNAAEKESDSFHQRWGWFYSATMIADHNRINLEQAMNLNIQQAFNDLAYLKAKAIYDQKQLKRK